MGRYRKYISNAEKQAAFRLQHPGYLRVLSEETKVKNRLRAKAQAKQQQSIQRISEWAKLNPERVRQSKMDWYTEQKQSLPFIAIDGEGITLEGKHIYTLLSSSLNLSIERWSDDGLSTQSCFEFLFNHLDKGIIVGFALNYDVNMWLKDLEPIELVELWKTKSLNWNGWTINWLKSKMFNLTYKNRRLTIYDVFGYFQTSFVKTGLDWKLFEADSKTHLMLEENKANRSAFNTKQRTTIKSYNLTECALLVQLMDKLRNATIEAGCMPRSWHGAASIAKALAAKYNIASHIEHHERMMPKFLRAYYGGRFQILQQGEFDKAYGHDISSAYPAALRTLPTSKGVWKKLDTYNPNKQWALYRVKWKTPPKEYLNPFPFRYKGEIFYPNKGEGWYYKPEIDVALQYYAKYIDIIEGYFFKPESDIKPYAFIDEIYAQRLKFKREGNDAQKALKLGMNSLYGITAQSVGWQGSRPKFQNYFAAGYITSICRAQVLELALKNKSSVIAFATDGVFSSKRLTDDVPGLGGWETDEIDNLFMLQSGVYSFGFEDNAQPIQKKSRGFRAASINYDELRKVWRTDGNLGKYSYTETRFIGLGSALPSLKEWRMWKECEREIDFTISDQIQILPNKILRILPDQPKYGLSEAYEPHKSWEEKDSAMGEFHDE